MEGKVRNGTRDKIEQENKLEKWKGEVGRERTGEGIDREKKTALKMLNGI